MMSKTTKMTISVPTPMYMSLDHHVVGEVGKNLPGAAEEDRTKCTDLRWQTW